MSKWMKLSGSTAIVALMTGSAAYADITGQQVWTDWKDYMQTFGYAVTASEATSGDTLTISDITMNITLPEDAGVMKMTIGEMSFTNQSDGTVAIGLPATMPLKINVMPKGEDPVDITLDYTNDGLSMVASGSANDMTYAYSAGAIGLKLKELIVEGKAIPVGAAEMSIRDVNGTSTMKVGNLRDIAQSFKAGAVTYNIDFANPEDTAEFLKFNGALAALDFTGSGSYPMGEWDMNNMDAMLKAGFAFAGRFSYAGGNSNFQFVEKKDTVMGSSSTDGGSLDIEMSKDVLRYAGDATNVAMNFQVPDLPFPVEMNMARSGFKIEMPVSKSDESQKFGFGLTLAGFTTSEMIWGMVDPGGQLPHDPATIAIDLTGTGKLAFDIMDPEQQAKLEKGELGMPGELESVALNNLEVTAAGASLTGKGAFDVDTMALMMSQGMSGAEGALDLSLTGANGLMDKLVAMGLVPQDQVMGVRMMMGMFAVPAGDDAFTSKIEVKKDGQILANGQRIK